MSLFTGVVLLGVVLAALTIGIWWKKTNVVEMLAFGVIYWLCAWVVTAMGFFVLDVFSLLPCAVGTVVLELAVGAAALIVRKKRDKTPWRELMTVSWDIRPYWLPILVCAGGFVLVAMTGRGRLSDRCHQLSERCHRPPAGFPGIPYTFRGTAGDLPQQRVFLSGGL